MTIDIGTERLRELADDSDRGCNRHINGACYSRACLMRGGWKTGTPVDYSAATCAERQIATALRALIAAREAVEAARAKEWLGLDLAALAAIIGSKP